MATDKITGTGSGVNPTSPQKVNPTPAVEQPKETAKSGSSATGATGNLGQQDFLMLLVNQLQNQDPLNPMDPKEFASELAQFSTVEQLINMNQKLDNLGGGPGSVGALAGFLGTEVVLKGGGAEFKDGQGPNALIDVPAGTQSLRIDVTDESGAVVGSMNVDTVEAGQQVISLKDMEVPDGSYTLRVVSVDSGGRFKELDAKTTGTVEGFVVEPEPALLIGGKQVGLEDVVEVYKGQDKA